MAPVRAAPPAAAISNADQMGALVIIETSRGVGSGFVTRLRDVDFIVTNLHVVGGEESIRATNLRGDQLPVHAVYGAVGRDVAFLRTTVERPGLESAEDVLEQAKIGEAVAVMGNSLGGGVATRITGYLTGVGADRIEVDARFQPGNSGSPVMHLPSGKVIGIASFILKEGPPEGSPLREFWRGGGGGEARWFAFRYDGVKKWEQVDSRRWKAQEKKIAAFREDSLALVQLLNGKTAEAAQNPRIHAALERANRALQQATDRGEAGYRIASFILDVKGVAEGGVKELEGGEFYDYFRSNRYWETSIPMQLELRAKIRESLTKSSDKFSVQRSQW